MRTPRISFGRASSIGGGPTVKLWMFLLLIAAIIGFLALQVYGQYRADAAEAERYARDYIAKFHPDDTLHLLDCIGADTDGNGYVSCSYLLVGEDQPRQIECAGTWWWQPKGWFLEGCKMPMPGAWKHR